MSFSAQTCAFIKEMKGCSYEATKNSIHALCEHVTLRSKIKIVVELFAHVQKGSSPSINSPWTASIK